MAVQEPIALGDIIQTKKPHPCGCDRWEVVRIGVDMKIKCLQCGRIIMLPRIELKRKTKKIISSKE
jgi:hypothetical protein